MIKVSIVIPSIGRETLKYSIASASSQNEVSTEVFVIDDSINQNIEIAGVQILRTGGSKGVSFARNLGVTAASGDWIAFLDDDDVFISKKLIIQINAMINYGWDLSYTSSYFFNSKLKRPKRTIIPGIDPFRQIYSKYSFFGSPFYLPLPSLVVSKEVSRNIKFDESLWEREDLKYVYQAFKKGFTIGQLTDPLVIIKKDQKRSLARPSLEQDINWAHYLCSIQKSLCLNFLFFVSLRNRLWCRDFIGAILIIKNFLKICIRGQKSFH